MRATNPTDPLPAVRKNLQGRLWECALVLVVVVGAIAGFVRHSELVFDDAFITYRYSQNLAAGNGLVFNPGERVLGTTAPLYALVLGLFAWLGAPIPQTSAVLFCFGLVVLSVAGALILRRTRLAGAGLLFAAMVMAGFGRIYELFGMETPFFAGLLFLTLHFFVRGSEVPAGACLGLAILTRYDAVLFAALLLMVTALIRWRSGNHRTARSSATRIGRLMPLRAIVMASSIALPWFAFSWLYFGTLTPNTLAAKTGSTESSQYLAVSAADQARRSLEFLAAPPLQLPDIGRSALLLLLACCWFAFLRTLLRRKPELWVAAAYPFLLWFSYAAIGAPARHSWHLLPASWLLLLLALGSLQLWLERSARRLEARRLFGRYRVSLRASSLLLTIAAVFMGLALPLGVVEKPLVNANNHGDMRSREGAYREIARFLETRDLGELRVLTREPGYLAFLSKNPMIDAAGLVTPGVFFHDADRRLDFEELVVATNPDLVVPPDGSSPEYRLPGYVPILWSFRTRQLFMRRDLVETYFDRMAAPILFDGSLTAETLERRGLWSSVWPGSELVSEMTGRTRSRYGEQGGFLRSITDPSSENPQWLSDSVAIARSRSPIGGLETPPVVIDFDEIRLRFGASEPAFQSAQLIVEGRLVLEEKGEAGDLARLRETSWTVGAWRGQAARVRFPNVSREPKPVVVDWIRTATYKQRGAIEDFEQARLDKETWSGFGETTTDLSLIASRYGMGLVSGHRAATSFGISGVTSLSSERKLTLPSLAFLVLDFCGRSCEVRLETVEDGVVHRRIRGRNSKQLRSVIWDMPELQGKRVRLLVVDRDPSAEAFVGIDDLIAFER